MLSKNLPRLSQLVAYRNLSAAAGALKCTAAHDSFKSKDLVITKSDSLKTVPAHGEAGYGRKFTDHMLEIDFDTKNGWDTPKIHKMQNLSLHPSAKALHYAIQMFEGMKAYRGMDNKVRLFRPELNMARMKRTAARSALPDFDGEELIKVIGNLVNLDANWVSKEPDTCLYLRPTLIGTEGTLGVTASQNAKLFVFMSPVDVYPTGGRKGIKLLADPKFIRAWPGGVGSFKMGSNYAPTMHVAPAGRAQELRVRAVAERRAALRHGGRRHERHGLLEEQGRRDGAHHGHHRERDHPAGSHPPVDLGADSQVGRVQGD